MYDCGGKIKKIGIVLLIAGLIISIVIGATYLSLSGSLSEVMKYSIEDVIKNDSITETVMSELLGIESLSRTGWMIILFGSLLSVFVGIVVFSLGQIIENTEKSAYYASLIARPDDKK